MNLRNHSWRRLFRILGLACIVGMGFFSIVATGGGDGKSVSDDGTGTIIVHNYDNHNYRVQLRNADDDTIVEAINVDEFDALDDGWTEKFVDVPEGEYYLVLYRDDVEKDRSNNFNIDEDDTDCFRINDDGEIKSC